MTRRASLTRSAFIGLIFCVIAIIAMIIFLVLISSDARLNAEELYQADIDIDGENIINSRFDDDFTPELRQPTPEEAAKYPQLTNLPALYITLNNDTPFSDVTLNQYIAGTYTIVYGKEGGIYEQPIFVKGRGNYSWSNPKKPYTVQLGRPAEFLGMNSAKKWVLLGEFVDKTLLRTYLTFNLARDISQGEFNPDCRYADVYLNGKYNGLYVITDSVQIYPNRVDIDEETEALFEIEATYRHDDHTYCVDMRNGSHHIVYKKPDDDDILKEKRFDNLAKFQDFFDEFHTALGEGYAEFSKYINVESFVNWYIVNELVKNYDSAFTSSCYTYIKDGILYMGPLWDYHTCYGNQEVATCRIPTGYHVRTSPWFSVMMDDEKFNRLVCERWTQLTKAGVIDNFVEQIPGIIKNMAESVELNYELWPGALRESGLRGRRFSKFTFEEEVDYLVDWLWERIYWLDDEWYIY